MLKNRKILVLISVMFSCFFISNAFANNTMPEFTIISIEENGIELVPEIGFDEYSNEVTIYHTIRSEASLTVKARLRNLEENKTYHFDINNSFTSTDNDQIVSFDIKPNCWKGTCTRDLSLYTDDNGEYHSYGNERLSFVPSIIGNDCSRIVSAAQNNAELDIVNGVIKSNDYTNPITVTYILDNYNPNYTYETDSRKVINPNIEYTTTFTPINYTAHSDLGIITITSYGGSDWMPIGYYSLHIGFEITNPDFVEFGNLHIDSIKQNNTELQFSGNEPTAIVNDIQPIEISLHAENAMDDVEYSLTATTTTDSKTVTFVGYQLKNGVSFNMQMSQNNLNSSLPFFMYISNNTSIWYNYKNTLNWPIYFRVVEDQSLGRFDEVELAYSSIHKKISEYATDPALSHTVSPLYHDENNPLDLIIKGKYYEQDSVYPVSIRIFRGIRGANVGEQIYSKEIELSGSELNSGTSVTLDNFTMDFMDPGNILLDQASYQIFTKIGDLEREDGYDYAYGPIRVAVFHKNGQQNATAGGAGMMGARYRAEATTMNKYAFTNNGSVLIFYIAEGIDIRKMYNYDIYYCDRQENTLWYYSTPDMENCEKTSDGSVSGARLAVGAIAYEAKNPKNYSTPYYIFRLKYGDKIINETIELFDLYDGAGILSAKIATSYNLYYQKYLSSYVVPRGNEVKITNTGVNFEPEKNYILDVSLNGYKTVPCDYATSYNTICTSSTDFPEFSTRKTVLGKDLNDGKIKINIAYNEAFNNLEKLFANISITDDSGTYYPGSGISIEYITLEDIFKTNQSYIMNSAENYIRGISKNTFVSNFISSFTQDNNGMVKVYDATGENEQNDTIGTGMIIRAMDEFEQPIVDTAAVVTGDVTGDGKISPTDLAKERQHLAGIKELEGAFEKAGRVTGSNKITLTDLAKIRQDIAGIKEIK